MATMKEKIDKRLNDGFIDNLHEYLSQQFPGVSFEKTIDLEQMRMVTKWESGDEELCEKIKLSLHAYESAYGRARFVVASL
jgi:hypothetical protein